MRGRSGWNQSNHKTITSPGDISLLSRTVYLSAILELTPTPSHGGVEIGPNGGRIFELESTTTPHLEIAAKDGKFVIHVLDANDKPIPLGDRTLTITGGDRANPEKHIAEKIGDTFTGPVPKGEKFPVVFQVREAPDAKPLTARLNYDATTCAECQKPEWLCTCAPVEQKK